jgi:hypothetical protein
MRHETYSGSREGWTLSPPYLAEVKILGGTNNPKDTAMTRFIPSGSYRF